MSYRQITFEERYTLGVLKQQGMTPAAIARALGRHWSTIVRQISRNRAHSDGCYRPQLADWYARSRRSRSRRNLRFAARDWARIGSLLRQDWSPEQVADCILPMYYGTEFHDYATIERATAARFYFATPHHAWERGTNENTNGLIRQYLPKRTSMARLTQQDCNEIARKLNRRPRKRLGYRTPEECYVP